MELPKFELIPFEHTDGPHRQRQQSSSTSEIVVAKTKKIYFANGIQGQGCISVLHHGRAKA